MYKIGVAPYLECSSKGDSRFSAFYARINARGNKSIEDIYQGSKVFEDGSTNLDWRSAKGKPCVNIIFVTALYSTLWDEYILENPYLLSVINNATGFSDMFGKEGSNCQAKELWRIKLSNPNHF